MTEQAEQEQAVKLVLRYIVTQSPGFAAIALWCPYVFREGDLVTRTDGRTITIGPYFFAYDALEQAAILVHEVLHVALRHIPRLKRGHYDRLLWNLCTDAVINETIAQMNWLKLPSDAVRMRSLLSAQELETTPAHQWTSEKLYHFLIQDRLKQQKLLTRFDPDLTPGSETEDPVEEHIWQTRLVRAQAGDRAGGLLRTVGHDFPEERIPWEKLLRRLMTRPLLPQTVPNWNRPGRRTLSLSSEFFEPGQRFRDGLHRAGVVVDTSGSIDDALLTRFAGEIQGIQQRTGCEIYLISADAAVQTEQVIKNDGKSFLQKVKAGRVPLKGGGGTDFVPALRRMKEVRAKVVVYLTDLYGNFGEETRYPFLLLWASTTRDLQAPFGTTLTLE